MLAALAAITALVKRAIEPIVAALLVLLLFEVHSAVVRTGVTLAGLSSETPTVLATQDGCGKISKRILALSSSSSELRAGGYSTMEELPPNTGTEDPRCQRSVDVFVGAPKRRPVYLFVNRELVDVRGDDRRVVVFHNIQLNPGQNIISAVNGDSFLWLPYGSRVAAASFTSYGSSYRSSDWFGMIGSKDLSEIAVTGPPADTPAEVVALWKGSGDNHWALVVGGAQQPSPTPGYIPAYFTRGAGIELVPMSEQEASGVKVVPRELFRRLRVVQQPDQSLQVTANACVPPSYPLIAAAKGGRLRAPQFVARLFGLQAGAWEQLTDRALAEVPTIAVDETVDPSCVRLDATYQVKNGEIWLASWLSVASFPNLPGDELTLEGSTQNVRISGRSPDSASGGVLKWKGNVALLDRMDHAELMILPSDRRSSLTAQAPQREEGSASNDQRGSMLSELRRLLPASTLWVAYGIATVAPIVLLFWTVRRHFAAVADIQLQHRIAAALIALATFVGAYSLQPGLAQLATWLLSSSDLSSLVPGGNRGPGSTVLVSIAFLVVILVVPLLKGSIPERFRRPHRLARVFAAIVTLTLLVAGTGFVWLENLVASPPDSYMGPNDPPPYAIQWALTALGDNPVHALTFLVLVWCLIGLLTLWLPIYWLLRSLTKQGPVLRVSIGNALLVFFLPLLAPAVDLVGQIAAIDRIPETFHGRLAGILEFLVDLAPSILIFVIVFLVLRAFREMARFMLLPKHLESYSRLTPNWFLWLLALAIVASVSVSAPIANTKDDVEAAILQTMSVFQTYAPVLALLAVITLAETLEAAAHTERAERFVLPVSIYLVMAAAFAGYLAIWDHNPISVLVLMLTSWFVFTRLVLRQADVTDTASVPSDFAARLIRFRTERRLLDERRSSVEKKYVAGEMTAEALAGERAQIETLEAKTRNQLGADPIEGKRHILSLGPNASPFQNAVLGATVGAVVALIMQVLIPLGGVSAPPEKASGWTSLLDILLTDPDYRLVPTFSGGPVLLKFFGSILNALSVWVIAGFLFGYVFHRIRGNDGFVKALVFGGGIVVTFLMSRALVPSGGAVGMDAVAPVAPVLVFFLILGTLIFDGLSLRRQGIGLRNLPDVYGLRASLGYASIAGALAVMQPILTFVDWLASKP